MNMQSINGEIKIFTTANDDWQHKNNPLHFFCRLIEAGVEKKTARDLTQVYEEVYKLALRKMN